MRVRATAQLRYVNTILTLMWMTAAAAPEPSRVVVVGAPRDQASKRAAQYMTYGLREAAKHDGRFSLVPLAALYGEQAADQKRIQQEADALAADGQTAADNLETEKAQQKFTQALGRIEDNLGEFDTPKPAARIALLAAGAALLNNNDKEGRSLISRALLYDPNCAPDPRNYNSAMMAVFKDVRSRLSRNVKGALSIASNPSFAEFFVDGDFIGLTPDKIDRINGGPHLVRVVRDGYKNVTQVVEVHGTRADLPVTVNLVAYADADHTEQLIQKGLGDIKDAKSRAIGDLAQKAGSQLVLYAAVTVSGDQTHVEAGLYRTDGKRLSTAERTFSAASDSYREEADKLWQGLADQAAAQLVNTNVESGERLGGHTPIKPIVTFSLIGLGAAGLVVGGVFGILALNASNNLPNLVQDAVGTQGAADDVHSKALIADVMYGVGGVLAVAGLLCLFLWDDHGAQRDVVGLGPIELKFGPGFVQAGGHF